MKKINFKKILIGIGIILLLGQFIYPGKNEGKLVGENHISTVYATGNEIEGILSKACYDCHSNNTDYPWYADLFPVSWYLHNHVVGGKKKLNFSEFASYSPKRQSHKMEEIVEMVEENFMPLKSYVFLHSDAKLSPDEKSALLSWASSFPKYSEE